MKSAKCEKLKEALIQKMQLIANKGTATDEVIKEGAQIVRQFCTALYVLLTSNVVSFLIYMFLSFL